MIMNALYPERWINKRGLSIATIKNERQDSPVLFLHHGLFGSSLSFSSIIPVLSHLGHVVSFDMRNHGGSIISVTPPNLELLLSDFSSVVIDAIVHHFPLSRQAYFVGHSLGGAIVTKFLNRVLTSRQQSPPLFKLEDLRDLFHLDYGSDLASLSSHLPIAPRGIILIDCIESLALNTLPHSISVRSIDSESVPDNGDTNNDATLPEGSSNGSQAQQNVSIRLRNLGNVFSSGRPQQELFNPDHHYSEPNFPRTVPEELIDEWFLGTSNAFISLEIPKLLIIPDISRIYEDVDLSLGRMDEAFKVAVVPNTGHFVHEDDPTLVSNAIMAFMNECM